MKNFIYHKPGEEPKERFVVEISPISDSMLAIDLTEYDEDERGELEEVIEGLKRSFIQALYDIGVKSNFRRFKEEYIEWKD